MEIKQYKLWKTEPSGKPDFTSCSKNFDHWDLLFDSNFKDNCGEYIKAFN